MRWAVAMLLLAGCITFDGGGQSPPPPGDGPPNNDATMPPDATTDASVTCTAGFMTINGGQTGHRYKAITTTASWNMYTTVVCPSLSSYLAIPNDASELQALSALFLGDEIWVGVSDVVNEANFKDVLGNPYDPLATIGVMIIGNTSNDDCVTTVGTGLDANPCTLALTGACECED